MKPRFFEIAVLGLAISGSAVASADCGSFSEMSARAHEILEPFGDLTHPDCSSKPAEEKIDDIIGCFESAGGESARERSEGDLQLASLYGAITQCYRSGAAQQPTGKKSFENLKKSTIDDPNYEQAWLQFAYTVGGFKKQSWLNQQAIQMGLGINIKAEVEDVLTGLESLPHPDKKVEEEIADLKS